MPVFFLPADLIAPPIVTITGDLLTHVRNSLRMTVGEILLLGDGQRRRYRAEITTVTKQAVTAHIIETLIEPPRTAPALALGQALLKGDKMDWIIQKTTELGVRTIVPVLSRHGIVQPKHDRIESQTARWQRIALEAAQQSEQWHVASVAVPQQMSAYLAQIPRSSTRLILAERRETSASLRRIDLPASSDDTITLLVGPEGGWSFDEIAAAENVGWTPITLGPHILRAETAAVVAIGILQHRLGALG